MKDLIKEMARPEIFALKPYVPGKPIEEVKRELGLDDIIKLASNESPLGASPLAMAAVEKSLPQLHQYPDANCFDLKKRLASFTGIATDGILIGNGSDEIIKLVSEAFLNRGDQVVYAHPSFSEYEFAAKIMGAECVIVPLLKFTHDLEAMLGATNDNTKMIYICNPNNPTGTIVDEQELDAFMARVPEDVLVIFDEAYCEYVESKDYISGLKYVKAGRNVVVLKTFSKIYGLAALRVGYGLTRPEIARVVEMVTEPFNVNTLGQVAALAAIDDTEHVRRSQEMNSAGKKYLYREFEKMGLEYVPSEANFIFLNTAKNCQEVFKGLLQKGIIVLTGDIFGHPDFIRVTVGSRAENERFIQAIRQVLAV